jgi:hypothetical protein
MSIEEEMPVIDLNVLFVDFFSESVIDLTILIIKKTLGRALSCLKEFLDFYY